ncbi:chloride channel protein [Halobacteriovorax sp. BALOs_7]|uniref:chloride channel protein n=1 Tax=Halobacteriovorax sp. BALOs_7 TaxID=2109558 RepID=UPI000EA2BBFB|nr:chloride channel protein [Halobacteriovorax sp. BALOs_7]
MKFKNINIKKYLLFPASWKLISLSISLGILMFFASQLLLGLISLITNLAFNQQFSFHHGNFGDPQRLIIIFMPIIGALILGLMAKYIDQGIRGHGIPEVIERIEYHESHIPFRILWLRPIACAISIGTGGPYGAEGPVIGMGGALGSFIARTFSLTNREKKVLLAAGAAAGISAVFGVPVGAIFLVSELFTRDQRIDNLFPIALCSLSAFLTRVLIIGDAPLFHLADLSFHYGQNATLAFVIMAIVTGITAALTIHAVELTECIYDKLPLHWMWWPVIGVIPVSLLGFLFPSILGASYELLQSLFNLKSNNYFLVELAVIKGGVWAFAVSSRTTSGTLAPLLIFGAGIAAFTFMQLTIPLSISPTLIGLASLVGAGSYFGAISGAPVSSALIVLEMTGKLEYLPLCFGITMIATLVTKFLVNKSIMHTHYS